MRANFHHHAGGGIFLRQAAQAFFVIGDFALIANLAAGVECADGVLLVAQVDADGGVGKIWPE
ncbi:MAG: hypothetical protein R3F19_25700 [Verrucomicrobiales bacterium]